MNDNGTQLIALKVQGVDLPVRRAPGNDADGIAIGHMGNEVFITISYRGDAYYVRLGGDDIDLVAHLMANAMSIATRADAPSMETRQ